MKNRARLLVGAVPVLVTVGCGSHGWTDASGSEVTRRTSEAIRGGVAGAADGAASIAGDPQVATSDPVGAERRDVGAARKRLPTGDFITPTVAPGSSLLTLNPGIQSVPNFRADHAASTATSPDGKTLVVLTSGYNETNWTPNTAPTSSVIGYEVPAESGEWIFVYDIAHNSAPVQKQVLTVPNSFSGIAFDPSGREFYVGGGQDDNVHVFDKSHGVWSEKTVTTDAGTAPATIALGHSAGLGLQNYPVTAGLDVTADGTKLIVANYENDSISIVALATQSVVDSDLRPGKQPRPRSPAWQAENTRFGWSPRETRRPMYRAFAMGKLMSLIPSIPLGHGPHPRGTAAEQDDSQQGQSDSSWPTETMTQSR